MQMQTTDGGTTFLTAEDKAHTNDNQYLHYNAHAWSELLGQGKNIVPFVACISSLFPLANPGEAIRPMPPPFHSYAVANTATFLFEACRSQTRCSV